MEKKHSPLQVLKKALATLKEKIKEKHNKLTSCLSLGQSISTEEKSWLDIGSGNTIEEVYAIEALEKALDYNKAYERLEDRYKAAVQRLQALAGEVTKVAGQKQLCSFCGGLSYHKR
ncbi:hypothetical protein F5148DRAFT_1338517 [Russula earlei]|uniref:Uncharacterized protein n=1 Tax=Russula earlei TaxID=71964 RepID=A0ACC0TW18_9AGAM|nr:hypothetical protein F5148DRAFT_1338517 [Russula earlei]